MKTKFELGELVYRTHSPNPLGRIIKIEIESISILYRIQNNSSKWREDEITNQCPEIGVTLCADDAIALCRFFGNMSPMEWDDIVNKQRMKYSQMPDISDKATNGLVLRVYQALYDATYQVSTD